MVRAASIRDPSAAPVPPFPLLSPVQLPSIRIPNSHFRVLQLISPLMTLAKLKIHGMNDEPKTRNIESHRNLRSSRAAPRPPFVPHIPGAPASESLGNNSKLTCVPVACPDLSGPLSVLRLLSDLCDLCDLCVFKCRRSDPSLSLRPPVKYVLRHWCFLAAAHYPTKKLQMFKSPQPTINVKTATFDHKATCENRLRARHRLSAHFSGPPRQKNRPAPKLNSYSLNGSVIPAFSPQRVAVATWTP